MKVEIEEFPSGRIGIIISGISSSDLMLTPDTAMELAAQLIEAATPYTHAAAKRQDFLSQALNEGDGTYKP